MQQIYCLEIKRKKRSICVETECNKYAEGKTNKCKKHGGGERCIEDGCNKSAKRKADKCIKHGGGARCVEPNCKASAIGKTDKCKKHGGGVRCVELNCKASAQGKTDKCITHGGGMRCVEPNCNSCAQGNTDKCVKHGGGARCVEPGCNKSAINKTDKCVKHGGGSRCVEPNCNASVAGKTDKCKAHGGGKRCNEPDCKASAISKTDKCMKHGGGVRCVEPNCKAGAQGKTDKCVKHGGGIRCPNCITWVDSRSGKIKYDGYCATCFKRCFPNDARSKVKYAHTKEIMVRNTINSNFKGFIHDIPLYTGNCDCTHRRRIDHRKMIGNTILAIETDEFGHRGYDKTDEEIRYDDLYMIHSGKWIFIRFNPDSNVSKTDIDDKLDKLIDIMQECIGRIEREENTELVEIIKLYC
jgi:hypothetical protein